MWFNQKYKNRITEMELTNRKLGNRISELNREIINIKNNNNLSDLMRESIGMQIDFSSASADKCQPVHFLEGLSEIERKDFISSMESIHNDDKFQKVVRFMINIFAMNMVYRQEETERIRNQGAVVAFRTFLKELDKMHTEFVDYKKKESDDFDPLATLPE